jgi:glycosyltransferase involved in cell wall biosynthesis
MAARSTGLLGLTMILKDEAATIAATLATVKPFIDRWTVLDTGSTDGTQAVVREALAGVPGEIVEEPFVDFATSRNRALELAGDATTFVMWLDADDRLEGGEALRAFLERERDLGGSEHDAFFVQVDTGVLFDSTRVARSRAGWRFSGVVHEVLIHADRHVPAARVPGCVIRHFAGAVGAERSKRRWERDAVLLEGELARDPTHARTAFYLALTYLWLERWAEAEKALERRVALGGWSEEVFYAKLSYAQAAERSGAPWRVSFARYLDAHAFAPHRAEPLHAIALHYDGAGERALALLFARRAVDLPIPPNDVLFVDAEIYRWKAHDLVASNAYWLGEHELGERSARAAVAARPGDARLAKNLEFYLARKQR